MESNTEVVFDWPEYLVFGTVLALSTGIGIFFGCFGSKNSTNAEYLLGNRKMHPFPVALSLICSYVSSITVLGHPVEVYLYGTQFTMSLLCFIPLTLSLMYFYVPFFRNLQLVSAMGYMELRFNRAIRHFFTGVNIIYYIFFMALVIYGPALALSQATQLDPITLVAVLFSVCIFYSTIGGLKAVLWTDSLQALIMISSMAAVVILGISNVGGLSVVFARAEASGRLVFFDTDFDLRTRHTIWTALIGGYFTWLPMYVNQAQVQRYISLPSISAANTALIINLIGLTLLMGLCHLGGLVMYANYYKCDPLTNKDVNAMDQLLPYFVIDLFENIPGLPGLFVAGITCAGLSTVSSVVNAISAIVVEDYVRPWKSDLTESKLTLISKVISAVSGLLAFGFVFIAQQMGSLFSAATIILGILAGPMLGVFVLGTFFPWTITWGAIGGLGFTYSFMGFLAFGARYYDEYIPVQYKELDVSSCPNQASHLFTSTEEPTHWKDVDNSALVDFFSMSEIWYPAISCLLTVIVGVIFSLLGIWLFKLKPTPKSKRLFIPLILKMWIKIFPEQMDTMILVEEKSASDIELMEPN